MDNITIRGKNLKARNRIHEHGNERIVIEETDFEVLTICKCHPEIDLHADFRWIKLENDPNFEVTNVK